MNIVAIIQARMGSTRLPGKAMLDICGEPMLARVMVRSQRAKTLSRVVVATTTEPADDVLCDLCAARGWPYYRGSQDDVLDRYYQTARQHQAEVVVRITSDCPVIDPEVIDLTVNEFLRLQPDCDYVSNSEPPRPFPRGLDVEAFHFRVLEQAWQRGPRSGVSRARDDVHLPASGEVPRGPGPGRPRLLRLSAGPSTRRKTGRWS